MKVTRLSRREFVRVAALAAAGAAASACGATPTPIPAATPTPVVIIKEVTKVVEVPKEVTKIVDRVVQASPLVTPLPTELGGTFIVGRGGDSVWLDVGPATDGESWRVVGEINEPLVRLAGTSARPVPWLAERWETKDNKTWTFYLRKGVKFHNGNPFNAEVVKWNMDRWRDEKNPYRFGRTFEYYAKEFGKDYAITDIKVIDETTIQITLAGATGILPTKLTLAGVFSMLDPKAVMEQGDKYGTPAGKPVGTGPFKFVEWVKDDRIVLERNMDWWGGPPRVARLIFRSIKDNSARYAELLAGTVQQADLAQTDMIQAMKNPNIQVFLTPPLSTGYINFQQCMPPFDKIEVR